MGELWDVILAKIRHSDGEDVVLASIVLFLCIVGPLLLLLGIFILEMQRLVMGCA
jgi:hypothetical protein